MPRYALVELSTMAVLNVSVVSSVPAVPGPGFRHLIENLVRPELSDWTPGDDPAVNEIWDGKIPAGFAPPPPPPIEDIEKSAKEIIGEIRGTATQLHSRADALENKLG
jgi:hypothetical protein